MKESHYFSTGNKYADWAVAGGLLTVAAVAGISKTNEHSEVTNQRTIFQVEYDDWMRWLNSDSKEDEPLKMADGHLSYKEIAAMDDTAELMRIAGGDFRGAASNGGFAISQLAKLGIDDEALLDFLTPDVPVPVRTSVLRSLRTAEARRKAATFIALHVHGDDKESAYSDLDISKYNENETGSDDEDKVSLNNERGVVRNSALALTE